MDNTGRSLSCDIAIAGSGVAGLCAALQAVLLGKKTILMESLPRFGGSWNGTYGIMGVESPISEKQDIHVDVRALVNQEVRIFHYQVDAKLWMDVADASGENIAWLMEQGVQFEEELEPYTAGEINAPVFHRWKKGSNPSGTMLKEFLRLGGTALSGTRAEELILEDGKVAGLKAVQGEETLTIRCGAVIAAGGGYAKNTEMVAFTTGRTDCACRAIGNNDGSTIRMCMDAGAKSLWQTGALITDLIPAGMKSVHHWLTYIHSRPGTYPFHIYVNQDGERYVNEACARELFGFQTCAAFTQEKTFTIYDEGKLKKLQELNGNDVFTILSQAAQKGSEGVFRADTAEELARKLGLDPVKLAETVRNYNGYCRDGKDTEYEKDPAFLESFETGPFYGWENTFQIASSLSGIDYNRKMEVLGADAGPVPGLYVAGTDGAKLWRDYYSLCIPGSCNANNVYSGRRAAMSAAEYIG